VAILGGLGLISVVVPAYNAREAIAECLEALLHQTVPRDRYEVIVVDDGSSDGTAEVVRPYGVKLLQQANQGPAAARNLGVAHAQGEIILFTDADCAPHADWIEQLTRPLLDDEIVGSKGVYRTRQRGLLPRFIQLEYEEKYERLGKRRYIDFVDAYSAGYRRDVFLAAGGFDEVFPVPSAEDVELSFRLASQGYRLVFVPQARVNHRHAESLWTYLRRKFNYGYWRVLVYSRYPRKALADSHTPQSLKAQVILAMLAASLVAGLVVMLAPWEVAASSLLIFLASTLPFVLRAVRQDVTVGLLSPFLLFLRGLALGVGLLVGAVHLAAERLWGTIRVR